MSTSRQVAVSYQPLSQKIYAGTLNAAGNAFLAGKRDVTHSAIAAAAQYILDTYPEGMVLCGPDGTGWSIDVTPLPAADPRDGEPIDGEHSDR
ncbi:hypothetical protein VX037_23365 [Gordonia sp. Z-3]|uniref:Uncharacterized protein n=1 Tax=Gordonia tangerina TaxID=2911060 RepID=A0ABS9DH29_9ACTN|nr:MULTISPECIES: hypothetical protein [Gordonia]MAU80685.1 hypothetical protein [Gordonia sp. (in: high G+C Gram-positive bacteria)]MCF3938524.1 hypothetical protein [Gordonia tangerina]MED5803969.1 hypothetical protein [Gordonia sp. Z-3]